MTNQAKNPNDKKYDLAPRTVKFGELIIDFAKSLPLNEITRPLITQLVKAGTSIGANYREADNAESRKDFRHKIGICKKEASESTYWLQILAKAIPEKVDPARKLWKEAHELTLIFGAIRRGKS